MHPRNSTQGLAPRAPAGKESDLAIDEEFTDFFRLHHDGIYRLLFRMTGERGQAEDLVQEAFLRAHDRAPLGDDDARKAWLYRVAINLGHNALRSGRRMEQRHVRAMRLETVGPAPLPDPAELLARKEEARRVREVLARLPARVSRILLLRYGGLRHTEVAAAMNISPASVGTLLARAEVLFEKAYSGR